MRADLIRFRQAIVDTPAITPYDPALLLERSGRLSCYYGPFDYINVAAKVVVAGITPGAQQARNALKAFQNALACGLGDAEALAIARRTASFSGPIRNNLVALLNRVGLHDALGLASCASLFTDDSELAHFTSVLRNPVFNNGKDYSGTPSILANSMLHRLAVQGLDPEIDALNAAIWVLVGKEPTAVLKHFVAIGRLSAEQVLQGLPHPSGANAERIAYFLGTKSRDTLSTRTNADVLDARLHELRARISALCFDSRRPGRA